MLQNLNNKRGGFTLVEIMIVVAIIALLSAIAVPNFLRARQRSQATRVLEDLRLVEAAKDQWALENNKKGGDTVVWANITPYLKTGSKLATDGGNDSIGNPIGLSTVNAHVTVSAATVTEFAEVVPADFWGMHAPAGGGEGGGGEGGGGEGGGA